MSRTDAWAGGGLGQVTSRNLRFLGKAAVLKKHVHS